MKHRILVLILLLFSAPLWAQDNLSIQYQMLSIQPSDSGSQLNLGVTLTNHSDHQYSDITLQLQDIVLFLADEPQNLLFHTLGPGVSKHRFLTLYSRHSVDSYSSPEMLQFHLMAIDESGKVSNHLIRATGAGQ